jgi:hypothetical protein
VAAWGQSIPVPSPSGPDALVYVNVSGAGPAGLEWLRGVLFKGNRRSITFDDRHSYRLVEATANDGLPLRSGRAVDYPAPFKQIPQAKTISLDRANLGAPSGMPLRYSFYEQEMVPWGN